MIRTFRAFGEKYNSVLQFNTESEEIKMYSLLPEFQFPFSVFNSTLKEMGYDSVRSLEKRMKEIGKKEIRTDRQIADEVSGILKLAKYRKEHGIHYDDVIRCLEEYTSAENAKKLSDLYLNHGFERHSVVITFENGTIIEEEINGTPDEIEEHYKIGSVFNIGSVDDNLQKVNKLEFIL